EFHIKSS
ncbi:hypothetical protein BN1708_017437, partial [Verticillium longisporum]